jgi:hypothetical protein
MFFEKFPKENLVHLDVVVVPILLDYVLVDLVILVDMIVLHRNQLLNDVVLKGILVE